MVGRETACRDDAMDIRMQLQVLSQGVKNADEADPRAETLGIRSHLKHG
jgi:hypothetical protein